MHGAFLSKNLTEVQIPENKTLNILYRSNDNLKLTKPELT